MTKANFIQRHIDIIKLLENRPKSMEEIQNYFDNKGVSLDKRTFQRDFEEIATIYNRIITYNRKEKAYVIEKSENAFSERLLNENSLINALQQSNKVSDFILLDDVKANGSENFNGILHALENKYIVNFNYHATFHKNEITNRTVEPLAIKEVQHRWYLIAYDTEKKAERTFALERILDFDVTRKTFLSRRLQIVKKFENAFGIECDGTPEKIVLRFTLKQEPYIVAKPIHKSQTKISASETHADFEYFMYQSNDLLMEIMKMGEAVEVVSPPEYRERAKTRVTQMMKLYK